MEGLQLLGSIPSILASVPLWAGAVPAALRISPPRSLKPAGGEQAVSGLQSAGSRRPATTLDTKVEAALAALSAGHARAVLVSHGSYQRRPCGTLPPCPSIGE